MRSQALKADNLDLDPDFPLSFCVALHILLVCASVSSSIRWEVIIVPTYLGCWKEKTTVDKEFRSEPGI